MERQSFIFYQSFRDAIKTLPPENQKNAMTMIIAYGIDGTPPDPSVDWIAYAIFIMAKPQLDINNKRFVDGHKWGRFWTLWGRPKTQFKPGKSKNNPTGVKKDNPKWTPNVNVNVNVNDNENVKEKVFYTEGVLNNLFLTFIENRKAIKKPMTDKAIEILQKKLAPYRDQEKIAMLEEAILHWWQSVYEPKDKNKSSLNPYSDAAKYKHWTWKQKSPPTLADMWLRFLTPVNEWDATNENSEADAW